MMYFYSRIVFLFFMLGPVLGYSQIFQPSADNLPSFENGKIQWADLDSDGDLDLLSIGIINDYMPGIRVHENVNGAFVLRSTSLQPIRNGGFALGDYDNDGDLDVFLSGLGQDFMNTSVLYTNQGGFSFTLRSDLSFPPLINSNAVWFDVDSDGDVDLLLTGVDDRGEFLSQTFLYENTGDDFVLITSGLPDCGQCAIACADANGDGKVDVMFTGFDLYMMGGFSALYLNNGDKTFSVDMNAEFRSSFNGDVKFGDFDNDGDQDLLLSGSVGGITDQGHTTVYENNSGVFTERSDIALAPSGGSWLGATAWLDYDNDGFLDIVVSGTGSFAKLYHNDGAGHFTVVSGEVLPAVLNPSLDVADYDNDGDIDICFLGSVFSGQNKVIFKNTLSNTGMLTKATAVQATDVLTSGAQKESAVTLYPNPATAVVCFTGLSQGHTPTTAIVRNTLGHEVLRQSITGDIPSVSVDGLAPGIYLVTLVTDRAVSTPVKFVKE